MTTQTLFTRLFTGVLPLLLMMSLSLTGCDEGSKIENEFETKSAMENSFLDSEFSIIRKSFDNEAQLDDLVNKTGATQGYFCSCSTVEAVDNGNGTYTMTIDFGSGCVCLDGRTRYGKLTGVFSGNWSTPGTNVVITPENYRVKSLLGTTYNFEFTKTITYVGENTSGNYEYQSQVENGVVTFDNKTMSWENTLSVEWIAGRGDLDPSTNVYLITGTANGESSEGVVYTAETDTPLELRFNCAHIVEGVFTLTPDGATPRIIDYGDGTCDAKATVSVGSFSAEIILG